MKVLGQVLPRLLSLVLLIELIVAVFTTPLLAVREVTILGLRTLKPAEVLAAAQVPLGRNLLRIGLRRIERRAAGCPVLDQVRASWSFPGTVVLKVRERTPVAVMQHNGRLLEIDARGVAYRVVPKPLPGVLLLQDNDFIAVALGYPVNAPSLDVAFQCMGLMGGPSAREISKISVDQNHNICLNIKDGVEVKLGQPERIPFKLAYLQRARAQAPQDYARAEYFDLSCPEVPSVKFRE